MLLGLDLGTGSAKALLVAPDGRVVASASAAYAFESPQPGWAQIEPLRWWQAARQCVQALPVERRAEVRAVGLSGQMHGVVLADAQGRSVHPALLWPDRRALAECTRYGELLRSRLANPVTPGMMGPMLLWLQRHEPSVFQRARWAWLPKDWLRWHLAGEAATDPSDASGTLLSTPAGAWDEALITALGLPLHLFAPVRPSCTAAGSLRADAAQELGLPAGAVVAVGAADTAASAFGSGLRAPGDAQLTVGSGAQIVVMRDACPPLAPSLNAYCAVPAAGHAGWYAMAAMQNAGTALEWVRALFGLTWDEFHAKAFTPEAAQSGAIFLPYLSGERTPWMSADANGAWIGLTHSDTPATLVHAALLGVAFSLRAGLEALDPSRTLVRRLLLAGGGTRHPAWRQMLADVLGCELQPAVVESASAYGAARIAAESIGLHLPVAAPSSDAIKPAAGDPHAGKYSRFLRLCHGLLVEQAVPPQRPM
jgi:sugar (pentulose or hexulose) kinase